MKLFFWSLLGETRPGPNPARRLAYIKALQRLLVAGTAGAFFFAIARNIPVHLKEASWHFDIAYTADRFLRYGYLLWLLAYFFISAVNNDLATESRHWRDIVFDVGQTVLSIVSAILLGFIVPDLQYNLAAYGFTNLTILLICIVSWCWFGQTATPGVNRLRSAGAAVSVASLVSVAAAAAGANCQLVLLLLVLSQVALWLILVAFVRIRVDAQESASSKSRKAE